ncbi:MAG: hypothetical protein KatS3mg063_1181 [Tepidiforma sp.]|uniref:hypothetical protein n=1 Tax=Tepidiforma sp. TaxID=2682230 RepID=UPI0021DE2614|nr:hypothetical protein [Tepidiforma sp.]GIW15328.1 MAG: hypothetical protein KatS3mg063_1181 [Tepidiforma sp.]
MRSSKSAGSLTGGLLDRGVEVGERRPEEVVLALEVGDPEGRGRGRSDSCGNRRGASLAEQRTPFGEEFAHDPVFGDEAVGGAVELFGEHHLEHGRDADELLTERGGDVRHDLGEEVGGEALEDARRRGVHGILPMVRRRYWSCALMSE